MNKLMDLHVIDSDNKYVVFHPESMSIFFVEESVGKILKYCERSDDLSKALTELDITEEHINKLMNHFNKYIKYGSDNDQDLSRNRPRSLCLIISQDCNLRCEYCYADSGEYRKNRQFMNINTAKKSIQKLLCDKNDGKRFILFFGGEPFLNFSLMEEIEFYRKNNNLNIEYSATTNGTILNNDIRKFLNENFFSITMSLDGMKEINDVFRYGNILSAHDEIVKNINILNQSRTYSISIKSVITKHNYNKIKYVSAYNGTLGVNSMELTPIHLLPPESKFYLTDNEYATFVMELSNSMKQNLEASIVNDKNTIYSSIFGLFRQLITKKRKIYHCSAGIDYLAISADGDVYPCHGCVGMDEFKMGNVHDANFPGEMYDNVRTIFINKSIFASRKCNICWARFLCGGDCLIQSYIHNKDLSIPTERHCIFMKSILETLLLALVDIYHNDVKRQNLFNKLTYISSKDQTLFKH